MEHTLSRYIITLRCQSWHVWSEMTVLEAEPIFLDFTDQIRVRSQLAVLTYLNRSEPAKFTEERTEKGPLLWRGQIPGFYLVRDTVLKAPEDENYVTIEHEHARRGEVDIVLTFLFDGELPQVAHDSLRSATFAFMSLLNLKLKDFLTPVGPLQIRRQNGAKGEFESTYILSVSSREVLTEEALKPQICEISHSLFASSNSERLRTSLELYGSHFHEREARVRFLLLVMAIESLATPSTKHPVALYLISQWQDQLHTEKAQRESSSPEFVALEALERELLFRRDDSIRSQVRGLVSSCVRSNGAEAREVVKRAMKAYDLRSKLVHTGHLDATEIAQGEKDAQEVLEFVLESLTQTTAAQ